MAYCTNCGYRLEDVDRFCASCGTRRRVEGGEGGSPAAPALAGSSVAGAQAEPPAWTQAASRPAGYGDWAEPPPAQPAAGAKWERITTRAGWAVAGLVIVMLVAGFGIIAYINEATLVSALEDGRRVSADDLETSDGLVAAAQSLSLVALVFSAVTFLMWLHLAWVNVERRRLEGTRWSASWAVGWWFIPIMNLFRPYQVMSILWKASQSPDDPPGSSAWSVRGGTPLLGWWWALYLAGSIVPSVFDAVRSDATASLDTVLGADLLLVLGLGMHIAAGVMAIMLVRRITAMHEHLRTGS